MMYCCNLQCDDDAIFYRRHLYEKADKIGPETTCFILDLWEVEQRKLYDRIKALFQLRNKYIPTAIEAACKRANFYNQLYGASLKLILKYQLHHLPLDKSTNIWGLKWRDVNNSLWSCS